MDTLKINIQEKIVIKILDLTGYQFPKHEGWFCRDSKSRAWLSFFGVRVVICNLSAKGA